MFPFFSDLDFLARRNERRLRVVRKTKIGALLALKVRATTFWQASGLDSPTWTGTGAIERPSTPAIVPSAIVTLQLLRHLRRRSFPSPAARNSGPARENRSPKRQGPPRGRKNNRTKNEPCARTARGSLAAFRRGRARGVV